MTEDSTTDQAKNPEFNSRDWFESLPPSQKIIAMMGAISVLASTEVQREINEGYKDSLTGLPNRRGFIRDTEKVISEHPNPKNLALAAFDLDELKKLNDTLGHDSGDEYLKFFADFLSSHLRRQDEILARNIAGRVGGDEFWALIDLSPRKEEIPLDPEVRKIGFEMWLRDGFEQAVQSRQSLKAAGGFSIGFAFYEEGKSVEELMKKADVEMYLQKKARGVMRGEA